MSTTPRTLTANLYDTLYRFFKPSGIEIFIIRIYSEESDALVALLRKEAV